MPRINQRLFGDLKNGRIKAGRNGMGEYKKRTQAETLDLKPKIPAAPDIFRRVVFQRLGESDGSQAKGTIKQCFAGVILSSQAG